MAPLAACAVATDPASDIELDDYAQIEEYGEELVRALRATGADLVVEGEVLRLRGGRRLHGIEMNGDAVIDCIPVLVAAACCGRRKRFL